MSDHGIKALAQSIYKATESGDVAVLDSLLSEDAVEHPLNPGQVRGRDAIKFIFGGFHMIAPDLSLATEDVVAEGDKVAFRSRMRGTPVGPYLGVEADGRSFDFGAIDIWRVQQGQIVEGWHVEDFLRILVDWQVVNLLPRVDSAASPGMGAEPNQAGDDPKTVIRRWYSALHRRDQDTLGALLAQGFSNHDPVGPCTPYSPDVAGTLNDIDALHDSFPDLDIVLADLFAEQGSVVARVIVRGTQLGPLLGLPPSGRRVAVMGIEIWRVANGQITEHWGRFEELDLLQQVGALPASAPA